MRTLTTGLWKEWRDQRGIAIALLVALPVLAFAAAWGFGGELPKPAFGGLSLFLLSVAQALYVLAVASESFGGERRRGTLDLLRRLPRGLPRAFGAKLGAYLLGTLLSLAWGAGVAWASCRLFGPERATRDCVELLLQPDPLTLTLSLALFVLGLWTLFLSNLVPQGGAATVGAALLLGLLAAPVYLALKDRPWLVSMPTHETLRLAVGGLGALATAALAVAFLKGCRLLGGVWGPAWRGLTVVLVVAGGGYAWGASALQRALTIDPHDPEFRMLADATFLGGGGRYLYATVHRGANPWYGWPQPEGQEHGSPVQPWIVDLRDGSWRVAGEYRQAWGPVAWNNRRVPQPVVRRYDHRDPQHPELGWFEARSGVCVKTLPADVRTADVLDLERWAMPALAWHEDATGRALWVEGSRLVREGQAAPPERWTPGRQDSWYEAIEGGWLGTTVVWDQDRRHAQPAWWLLDAATGAQRDVERGGGRVHNELVLSVRTALRREFAEVPRGQKAPLLPWTLADLEHGGATRPTVNPPDTELLVAALPGERALVMAGADPHRRTLSSWDPRTGETRPIVDADGRPFVGRTASLVASAPGGLRVVRVVEDQESWPAASALLMDDALTHAWRLPWNDVGDEVIAIESARSVVALRRSTSIVRHALVQPVDRAHEVFSFERLFPR